MVSKSQNMIIDKLCWTTLILKSHLLILMISVKTINNQNAITNAVLGLDGNSNTIINGNLTLQDTSGSFVITPSGTISATNTTLNNLTVNGGANFNNVTFFNSGGRVFNNPFIVQGIDLRVMDSGNLQGIQIYNSNVLGDNSTGLLGIGANSKYSINTRDSTTQRNNFVAEYGNHIQIKGLTGGVDCLNDTVNLFSSTTTPTMTIAPTFPDDTNKIATTSFVTSAITNINAATVNLTTDDNNVTCYIPFTKTTTATGNALYIDNVTTPLSYIPSTGELGTTRVRTSIVSGPAGGTGTCSLYDGQTTGSVFISGAQTTGSINIGATTCTTGLLNIRCPIVLARQIQTTNSTSYPPTAVTHLGYTIQTLGASFTTTSLTANTNTNLFLYAFGSANYGTYLFTAIVALSPNDNTSSRQLILAISQTSATVTNTPFIDLDYSTANVGYSYLKVQGVIPIYTGTPIIYLVGYCLGSAATVQTINSLSHFSYTRIA